MYSPTATYNSADSCSGTPFAGKEALQLITPANGGIPNAVPLLSMELPGSPPPPTFPLSAFPSAFGHMSGPTPDQVCWHTHYIHMYVYIYIYTHMHKHIYNLPVLPLEFLALYFHCTPDIQTQSMLLARTSPVRFANV